MDFDIINQKSINFPFSKELNVIFQALNKNDNLRIVGGAIRDLLLDKKIGDIDLACTNMPEKTINILESNKIKVIPTGIRHGTVTAIINNKSFEITTLRKDINPHGRKSDVEFIDSFLEDARRRDFTINAISIDKEGNLFDYFNGLEDLKNGVIRFIGDPKERIREDYLRILRFFRFSCYYSREFHQESLGAAINLKDNIRNLSDDRIRNEILKIIDCQDKERLLEILELMQNHHILAEILLFNDFNLTFFKNLLSFDEFFNKPANILLKFALLIYSQSKFNKKISKTLNFPKKNIKYIDDISKLSDIVNISISKHDLIDIMFDFDQEIIIDALRINLSINHNFKNKEILEQYLRLEKFILEVNLPKFIINGNDLLDFDINPRNIANILKMMRKIWINSNFKLDKNSIITMLPKLLLKLS